MSERYSVNVPNVVHESLDDEVVLIHLERGTFYNFSKTGIEIWEGLVNGLTRSQLVSSLLATYEAEATAVQTEVNRFIDRLLAEDLIVSGANAPEGEETSQPPTPGETKLPFEAPVMEKFTDMQDLLLLDPIHQVSEAGWPNVPDDKSSDKSG